MPEYQDNIRITPYSVYEENAKGSEDALSYYTIFMCMNHQTTWRGEVETWALVKGDLVFSRPGSPFTIEEIGSDENRRDSILLQFHEAFWAEKLLRAPELNYLYEAYSGEQSFLLRTPEATWQGLYSALLMLLNEAQQEGLCQKIAVESMFLTTMVHMNRTVYFRNFKAQDNKDDEVLLRDITHFLHDHFMEDLSLPQVSAIFHVSPSKVSHLFKKRKGISVYQYVLQRRLIYAKNEIIKGRSISDVAMACGFTEYTSFYKAFRKNYKISPKMMQKLSRV